MNVLASVIIPVFNRPGHLRNAVAQCLAQTHRPIEILIVNDGSTDETPRVAEDLRTRHPEITHVVHQPNGGPGSAREAGRQLASGEFLQYLDTDDRIAPEKLSVQVAALRADASAGAAYCRFREVGEDGRVFTEASFQTGQSMRYLFPQLLRQRVWNTNSPLLRRAASDQVGPWLPLRFEEDWEYDSRLALHKIPLVHQAQALGDYVHHSLPRASSGAGVQPEWFTHRAEALLRIAQHAEEAGVSRDDPNRIHFASRLFLVARQCGRRGYHAELHELLRAARCFGQNRLRTEMLFYEILRNLFGGVTAGMAFDFVSKVFGRSIRRK